MPSIALLQNELEKHALPADVEERVREYLTVSIGPAQLGQMMDVMQRSSFVQNTFYQERYMLGWGMCVDVLAAVEGSRYAAAAEILSKAESDPNMEFGKIFLPFLIDLTELLRNKGEDSQVLQDVVRRLRVAHMRYLSISALLQLVQYDVIYFLRFHEQFLSDIRYLYYVAEPEYDGGEWGRQFVPVLKKNQELLGAQIVVLGKPVAATVEHWLAEYDVASGKQALERGALDRIKFVNEHPNAKQLSKEDQAVLLKLCELYDWFADPFVTEAELGEFVDLAPATTRAGLVSSGVGTSASGEEADGRVAEQQGELQTLAPNEVTSVDVPIIAGERDSGVADRNESGVGPARLLADSEDARPNVQGVLVQVPLGASERTGLEVMQEHDALHVAADEPSLSKKKEQSATAQVQMAKTEGGAKGVADTASLETIKMQAQAKQTQMQAEIEQKLAQLKRKT